MIKLIGFDLDGTLIDSRHDLASAVNYARSSFGENELDVEKIVSFVGNGAELLVRRAIADTTIDLPTALFRMKKYYKEHLTDCTTLYSGVACGVKSLYEAGVKLAVVTNKPQEATVEILKAFNLDKYFENIIGGDSDFPLKPEPDALNYLIEKYNFSNDECIFLGDNYTDLECARHAKWRSVLAKYGFGDPKDENFEFSVDNFSEFVKAIH